MRSKYEKKADKELQEQGFETDYKARPFRTPRGYNVDYFGRFDLLAWYPDTGRLSFIAIKGHQGVPRALRKAIEEFSVRSISKEIWTYNRKGEVKKERIS